MIQSNSTKCTGCEACNAVCPFNAICMVEDVKGFYYPTIDNDKCKNCGLCEMVCPVEKSYSHKDLKYYAVQHKNSEIRASSQSGGLFSALAEVILSNGGVCYGAAIDNDFSIKQTRIESLDDLYKLQGSKYVQSTVGLTFRQVAQDLKMEKQVLYSGTSCMISGLVEYLNYKRIDLKDLTTCDLICHGVPSPKIWKDNIEFQKKKYGALIKTKFRDKDFGWHSHVETYEFLDGKIVHENFYTELFYSHAALRSCCYQCEYVQLNNKLADITMADFWGISSSNIGIQDDNTGVSIAVIHSDRGQALLDKANLQIEEIDEGIALKNNMKHSVSAPVWRDKFWADYTERGYMYCLRKYSIYGGIIFKIKRRILKKLKRW